MRPREWLYESANSEISSAVQATTKVSPRSVRRSVSDSVKVREFAEERKAFINLLRIELLQAFRAEALHGKRTHHSAIEHRLLESRRRQLFLRSEITEEPPCERIARSGGIDNLGQRQRRGTEGQKSPAVLARKQARAEECSCSVFAMLHHKALRA